MSCNDMRDKGSKMSASASEEKKTMSSAENTKDNSTNSSEKASTQKNSGGCGCSRNY